MITLGFYFYVYFPVMPNKKYMQQKNGARHFKNWRAMLVGVSFFQNAMKVLMLCIVLSNSLEKFEEVIMKNVMFAHVDILFLKCGLSFIFL